MSQTIVETVSNAGNRLSLTSVDNATTSAEQEPSLYRYSHLLPSFDPNEYYPPLDAFEHTDPGFRALSHKDSRSFLANGVTNDLTPWFGTEISNVDLLSLNEEGRDQLALETARRGVLVFRDQEHWLNADTDAWVAFASYFGRLHIHPTSGHPHGYPQVHLVYRDAHATYNYELDQNITATVWHSDVSYEIQPPGLTIFFLLDQRAPCEYYPPMCVIS
jgi:sulfonate dioxygenase